MIQMDIGFLRGILWKVANPRADRVRKLETKPEMDRPPGSDPNNVLAGRGTHLAVFGLLTDIFGCAGIFPGRVRFIHRSLLCHSNLWGQCKSIVGEQGR